MGGHELVLDQVEDLPGPRAGGVDKLNVKTLGRWIFQHSMSERVAARILFCTKEAFLPLALDHSKASTFEMDSVNGVFGGVGWVRRAGCAGRMRKKKIQALAVQQVMRPHGC